MGKQSSKATKQSRDEEERKHKNSNNTSIHPPPDTLFLLSIVLSLLCLPCYCAHQGIPSLRPSPLTRAARRGNEQQGERRGKEAKKKRTKGKKRLLVLLLRASITASVTAHMSGGARGKREEKAWRGEKDRGKRPTERRTSTHCSLPSLRAFPCSLSPARLAVVSIKVFFDRIQDGQEAESCFPLFSLLCVPCCCAHRGIPSRRP